MPVPVAIAAAWPWLVSAGGVILRFAAIMIGWVGVNWGMTAAKTAGKVAVFWVIWEGVDNHLDWFLKLVWDWMKDWVPQPDGAFEKQLLAATKCTEAWFPWSFLGSCAEVLIAYQIWLVGIKITVRLFEYTTKAVQSGVPVEDIG